MRKPSRSPEDAASLFRPTILRTILLTLCVLAAAVANAWGQSATPGTQGPSAQKASSVYACPMHPGDKSAKPGKCPKCGMTLQPTGGDEGESAAAIGGSSTPASPGDANKGADLRAGRKSIPDLELLDQDGRKVRFYTDLVKGKTVVINFIFTTCTAICPPLGATFARVQRELGAGRVGQEVHFISVSVDPATDTPERLKAWGAKFHAGPGWTFVTGDKPRVDELLRALAASSARREDHSPVVLIINDATGVWTRTYGLAKPSQLITVINDTASGAAATGVSAKEPERK